MVHDSMVIDAPAAQLELTSLKKLKVGDVRKSELFGALEEGLDWTCTKAEENRWEFDGKFVGILVFQVVIVVTSELLTLEMI